ncbi:MAG: metalloregulator ArsR/SmtB family transcription factor, partial [Pseudohongiellaceae bacterium]
MSHFKKAMFGQFARIGKALSSGHRLEILEFLSQCDYSVEELAKACGLSVANTSHHLQQLRQAGLVTSRKQGQHVHYRLESDAVPALLDALRGTATRHLTQVEELVSVYLTSKDELEPVSRNDLMRRTKEGSVTVIDVRPAVEYAAGHVPGAVNIPLARLRTVVDEIDPENEVIAYCRGPYCILAFDAVELLRKKGYRASRLEDGFPEWKRAGLP